MCVCELGVGRGAGEDVGRGEAEGGTDATCKK